MLEINNQQLNKVIKYLNDCCTVAEFDFFSTSPDKIYPSLNNDWVIDFFFTTTLQQFCFWYLKNNKYDKPMIGLVDGFQLKGSDYLWYKTHKIFKTDKDKLSLNNLAKITIDEFNDLYADDNGNFIMPMSKERVALWNNYAKDMLYLKLTPYKIVYKSNKSKKTIEYFINCLKKISGYNEDPLLKKAYLLCLILIIRPEKFLVADSKNLKPIVDYHIQRSLLRMGIVEITDEKLLKKVVERILLSAKEEEKVRKKCYEAIENILKYSNKNLSEIDYFFFVNRVNCPELSIPDCSICINNSFCLKKKDLFQPVFETTFY